MSGAQGVDAWTWPVPYPWDLTRAQSVDGSPWEVLARALVERVRLHAQSVDAPTGPGWSLVAWSTAQRPGGPDPAPRLPWQRDERGPGAQRLRNVIHQAIAESRALFGVPTDQDLADEPADPQAPAPTDRRDRPASTSTDHRPAAPRPVRIDWSRVPMPTTPRGGIRDGGPRPDVADLDDAFREEHAERSRRLREAQVRAYTDVVRQVVEAPPRVTAEDVARLFDVPRHAIGLHGPDRPRTPCTCRDGRHPTCTTRGCPEPCHTEPATAPRSAQDTPAEPSTPGEPPQDGSGPHSGHGWDRNVVAYRLTPDDVATRHHLATLSPLDAFTRTPSPQEDPVSDPSTPTPCPIDGAPCPRCISYCDGNGATPPQEGRRGCAACPFTTGCTGDACPTPSTPQEDPVTDTSDPKERRAAAIRAELADMPEVDPWTGTRAHLDRHRGNLRRELDALTTTTRKPPRVIAEEAAQQEAETGETHRADCPRGKHLAVWGNGMAHRGPGCPPCTCQPTPSASELAQERADQLREARAARGDVEPAHGTDELLAAMYADPQHPARLAADKARQDGVRHVTLGEPAGEAPRWMTADGRLWTAPPGTPWPSNTHDEPIAPWRREYDVPSYSGTPGQWPAPDPVPTARDTQGAVYAERDDVEAPQDEPIPAGWVAAAHGQHCPARSDLVCAYDCAARHVCENRAEAVPLVDAWAPALDVVPPGSRLHHSRHGAIYAAPLSTPIPASPDDVHRAPWQRVTQEAADAWGADRQARADALHQAAQQDGDWQAWTRACYEDRHTDCTGATRDGTTCTCTCHGPTLPTCPADGDPCWSGCATPQDCADAHRESEWIRDDVLAKFAHLVVPSPEEAQRLADAHQEAADATVPDEDAAWAPQEPGRLVVTFTCPVCGAIRSHPEGIDPGACPFCAHRDRQEARDAERAPVRASRVYVSPLIGDAPTGTTRWADVGHLVTHAFDPGPWYLADQDQPSEACAMAPYAEPPAFRTALTGERITLSFSLVNVSPAFLRAVYGGDTESIRAAVVRRKSARAARAVRSVRARRGRR